MRVDFVFCLYDKFLIYFDRYFIIFVGDDIGGGLFEKYFVLLVGKEIFVLVLKGNICLFFDFAFFFGFCCYLQDCFGESLRIQDGSGKRR